MGLFELGIEVLMGAATELDTETQRSEYGTNYGRLKYVHKCMRTWSEGSIQSRGEEC